MALFVGVRTENFLSLGQYAENIDLIRQDRTRSRTIPALYRGHRVTAEGMAQLVAEFFQRRLS